MRNSVKVENEHSNGQEENDHRQNHKGDKDGSNGCVIHQFSFRSAAVKRTSPGNPATTVAFLILLTAIGVRGLGSLVHDVRARLLLLIIGILHYEEHTDVVVVASSSLMRFFSFLCCLERGQNKVNSFPLRKEEV